MTPSERWKNKNIQDALVYAAGWLELIPKAVNSQSRLIAENFYQQALAEVERIKAMDYSQFTHIPLEFAVEDIR